MPNLYQMNHTFSWWPDATCEIFVCIFGISGFTPSGYQLKEMACLLDSKLLDHTQNICDKKKVADCV